MLEINVSVQHNAGFIPCIILSTQCYYHRGTRLNAIKRFVLQPIKLMFELLTIPFLSLTHTVTSVRYGVNYKHHKTTGKYAPYSNTIIGQFSDITSISIIGRLPLVIDTHPSGLRPSNVTN